MIIHRFKDIKPGQVRLYDANGLRCKYFVLAYDPERDDQGTVIILESSSRGEHMLEGTQEKIACGAMFFGLSTEVSL